MLPRRDLVVVVVLSSEGEMGCARMSQASSAEGASTRYCKVARHCEGRYTTKSGRSHAENTPGVGSQQGRVGDFLKPSGLRLGLTL